MTVVGASVVVQYVAGGPAAKALWQEWLRTGERLVAPDLFLPEVANALYQRRRHGRLSEQALHDAVSLASRVVDRVPSLALTGQAVRLAAELGLPATYDAH